MKKKLSGFLVLLVFLPVLSIHSQAKTLDSTSVENVFFYAVNDQGEQILLRVMPLTELEVLQHGQLSKITSGEDTGENYYVSYTDNFPTTGYCEGKGFTVMELVDYIKKTSPAEGVEGLAFDSEDIIHFMATDGGGTYARSYTYTQMYDVKRYYFKDLYDSEIGWSVEWEVPASDLDSYQSLYAAEDPYYENKREVFRTGEETCVILAYESYAGRTSGTLVGSLTGDIANYVAAQKEVTGCLASVLDTEYALRVCFPQTEAQLMCGVRTASENFKWIYNLCLEMEEAPALVSQGMVAAPEASFQLSEDGNTLEITLQCATEGASIYYSYDGAPQFRYTEPISYDVTGRDLETDPIYICMTAVKEGYQDTGVTAVRYYMSAPDLPVYDNVPLGDDVVFYPREDTPEEEWSAWISAIRSIEMLLPNTKEYVELPSAQYTVDPETQTLCLDASIFETIGDYRMIFHADGYASKITTRRVRYETPELFYEGSCASGDTVNLCFQSEMGPAVVAVRNASGFYYTTIPAEYLEFSDRGLAISGDCFLAEDSVFTGPGIYQIRLRSSETVDEFMYAYLAVDYIDLDVDAEYREAVDGVIRAGLMSGTSDAVFAPDMPMTRAMLWTVLYRMAGVLPADSGTVQLSGSEDSAWYWDAAVWAYENGLLDAVSEEALEPDAALTCGQLWDMLCHAGLLESAEVPAWAAELGVGDAAAEERTVTRAQAARFIYHFCED